MSYLNYATFGGGRMMYICIVIPLVVLMYVYLEATYMYGGKMSCVCFVILLSFEKLQSRK